MRKFITILAALGLFALLIVPTFAQEVTEEPTVTTAPVTEPTAVPTMAATAVATMEATEEMSMMEDMGGPTVADFIVDNYVRLGEAVQTAGLVDTLNSGDFTVFVPNDGAFLTLLNDLDISLNDLYSNPALLEGVITYHVVPGIVTSDDILNGGMNVLDTVHGGSLAFGYNDVTSRVTINGGAASIEQPDIVLSNGIVHVIDNVLLPPDADVLMTNPMPEATEEAVVAKSLLDISSETLVRLTELVNAAGLADELASGEYTLLAPNDGAFTTLLNELDTSYEGLLGDQELLMDVLTYHLIPGTLTAQDLTGTVTTVNGATLNFGYDPSVSRITINGGAASVEQTNFRASNGVMHIIDNVLLPPQ